MSEKKTNQPADVVTIDCHYIKPQVAASYLLKAGDGAAFIDNNTKFAVPRLMQALKEAHYRPDDVSHIIVTHVHLDHAGGTGELAKQCPQAKVLAHPKAAKHLADPSRLVTGTKDVYGEEAFKKLYGEIEPVEESRIETPEDGSWWQIGNRKVQFLYTRGHANHHFVIYDPKSNSVFAGDNWGVCYPMLQQGDYPFLFPSTAPTDFDANEARKSLDIITDTQAERAYPTHFGAWHDMQEGYRQMQSYLDDMEEIFNYVYESNELEEDIEKAVRSKLEQFFKRELSRRNLELSDEQWEALKMDMKLNGMGLIFAAQKKRKKDGRAKR